jgi:hypothetical protein
MTGAIGGFAVNRQKVEIPTHRDSNSVFLDLKEVTTLPVATEDVQDQSQMQALGGMPRSNRDTANPTGTRRVWGKEPEPCPLNAILQRVLALP